MAVKKKAVTKKAAPKKKRTVKKRVGVSQTKPSMATKKAPSARLKKRRVKNTRPGYYPNPVNKGYVLGIRGAIPSNSDKIGYWSGATYDTDPKKAVIFQTLDNLKAAIMDDKIRAPRNWNFVAVPVSDILPRKK